MKRGRVLAVLLVGVLFCVAGCSTIPRSGPVAQSTSVSGVDDGFGPVDYLPSGPTKGATQKEILRGFVDAAVSPQDGYSVAQQFLTPKFSTRWNPDASVTVDTGSGRVYTSDDADHMLLSVTPVAFVDGDGDYRRSDSSVALTQPYTFQKVEGQWRISKAPDGIVIDSPRFTDVFSAHTLYFFSPDFAYLVPDQRWFPSRPSTQTRVVKALVAGPAKWLAGAVVSAFPQGAQLTADSVPVSSGRAAVPLEITSAISQLALQRLKLQLVESLSNIPSITGVTISIDGVERQVPDLVTGAPQRNPVVDANPLIEKDGKFGFLAGDAVVSVPGISDKVTVLEPSAVTLSADRTVAAVLNPEGVFVVRASVDGAKLVDDRSGVIAPSLDGYGFVWSVPTSSPNALRATGVDGAPITVSVAWPDAVSIASIAVSRDGTRLAALVNVGGSQHVMAAGIIRGDNGKPDHLADPVDFGAVAGRNAASLGWLDELTVAALSRDAQAETIIPKQVLGGEQTSDSGPGSGSGPVAAVSLVGGSGVPPYWVLTSSGSLQSPRGTGWQEKSAGVTLLATQLGTNQ